MSPFYGLRDFEYHVPGFNGLKEMGQDFHLGMSLVPTTALSKNKWKKKPNNYIYLFYLKAW